MQAKAEARSLSRWNKIQNELAQKKRGEQLKRRDALKANGAQIDAKGYGPLMASANYENINTVTFPVVPTEPTYSYDGERGLSASQLYLAILINKTADQLGIKDLVAIGAAISGVPVSSKGKRLAEGTKKSSPASKYLSKKLPQKMPFRLPTLTGSPKALGGRGIKLTMTKVLGRFAGRAIPVFGWAVLAYDAGMIIYNTQEEYNKITNGP